jgi:hypothetical protein
MEWLYLQPGKQRFFKTSKTTGCSKKTPFDHFLAKNNFSKITQGDFYAGNRFRASKTLENTSQAMK